MVSLIKSISKKEYIFLGLLFLLVLVVTAIPYLYGYFSAPDGTIYSGIHHLTPGDTNVQLSMIEQVKQGNNIFLNLYTSESQARLLISPVYLSIGWMAKIFSIPSLLALHIARSFLIAILIFVLYIFLSYFFSDIKKKKWILVILLFSSGLGVFFNPFLFDVNNIYEHPTDIWVPESITFLTMYHLPHLIASLILIILIFLLILLSFKYNKFKYSLSAGGAGLLLIWFHPFNGPTVYLTIATYLIILFTWQRKIIWSYVKHYIVFCLIPIPAVLYLFLLSATDDVIRQWAAQNILPSPSIWMYLIGYGLLVPLMILGLWRTLKKLDYKGIFLIAWLISSSMLIYIPLTFQRRMAEGLHIPIAILASLGIFYLIERIKIKNKFVNQKIYALVFSLVLFLPLTNYQILGQDIFLYNSKKTLPYYIDQEEIDAMTWLKLNINLNQIIFSSFYTGNYIPAYSGRIVWIGHGPQTINLPAKFEISNWFWENDTEVRTKHQFLKENKIDFVYFGFKEKEYQGYQPDTKDYLMEVFENKNVTIYKVI